jgi:hypothetical protein
VGVGASQHPSCRWKASPDSPAKWLADITHAARLTSPEHIARKTRFTVRGLALRGGRGRIIPGGQAGWWMSTELNRHGSHLPQPSHDHRAPAILVFPPRGAARHGHNSNPGALRLRFQQTILSTVRVRVRTGPGPHSAQCVPRIGADSTWPVAANAAKALRASARLEGPAGRQHASAHARNNHGPPSSSSTAASAVRV